MIVLQKANTGTRVMTINKNNSILVVDDNEMNRDMLSRRLQRKGFTVDTAEDGYAALRALESGAYALVLLDIMMPGMSGMEVLARIRETQDGTELPVIMATAKDQSSDIVAALEAGANDYVTKPLELPVVLARVNTQLALKAANDRVRALAADLERRNVFIREVFGRYLTDDIADTVLDSPDGLEIGGERRDISILMADLRGFTTHAANRDPGEVMVMVNHFLSTMTGVILDHGGTIDEFIGDAVLALFGAPRPMQDHAAVAVACALDMQAAMTTVNAMNVARGLPEVAMGIGIHSGAVIVGNIGSERRAKYGVVGDNVNFTARVESCTRGGQVLVSAQTRSLCGNRLTLGEEMTVKLKGYEGEVVLYEPVSITTTAGQDH